MSSPHTEHGSEAPRTLRGFAQALVLIDDSGATAPPWERIVILARRALKNDPVAAPLAVPEGAQQEEANPAENARIRADAEADPYCPACGEYMPKTLDGTRRIHDCDRTPPVGDLPPTIYACPVCGGHGAGRYGCWGTEKNPHAPAYMRPLHELLADLRARQGAPVSAASETREPSESALKWSARLRAQKAESALSEAWELLAAGKPEAAAEFIESFLAGAGVGEEGAEEARTPFQRVTDDLTGGCGCACHTGTGYRTSCEHCAVSAASTPGKTPAGEVREALSYLLDYVRYDDAVAALDALVAERNGALAWRKLWDEATAERLRVEAERDEARAALRPFTFYDFHATQWLDIRDGDGDELRTVKAADIADLIGFVKAAQVALAGVSQGEQEAAVPGAPDGGASA